MAGKLLRLFSMFLSTAAVLLCGCMPKQTEDAPRLSFSADFTADYGGMALAGHIVNTRQGVCSLRMTAPETLAGLHLRWQDAALSLTYDGAGATADEPYLPGGSFPAQLRALLQTAAKGDWQTSDGSSYTLALSNGEGVLTVDENRLPQSAQLPDGSTVRFFHATSPE